MLSIDRDGSSGFRNNLGVATTPHKAAHEKTEQLQNTMRSNTFFDCDKIVSL
jgi:hypothetical protein